jgi:prepilin-type N-terminal cleavage/methylation domain-containing protein
MKRFLQTLKKEESGFTLIELLVVIAILGAIAGVVIINVSSFIGQGQCEGYCTEKHNIVTACYAAKVSGNGTYTSFLGSTPKYTWTVDANTCVVSATNAPASCSCDN